MPRQRDLSPLGSGRGSLCSVLPSVAVVCPHSFTCVPGGGFSLVSGQLASARTGMGIDDLAGMACHTQTRPCFAVVWCCGGWCYLLHRLLACSAGEDTAEIAEDPNEAGAFYVIGPNLARCGGCLWLCVCVCGCGGWCGGGVRSIGSFWLAFFAFCAVSERQGPRRLGRRTARIDRLAPLCSVCGVGGLSCARSQASDQSCGNPSTSGYYVAKWTSTKLEWKLNLSGRGGTNIGSGASGGGVISWRKSCCYVATGEDTLAGPGLLVDACSNVILGLNARTENGQPSFDGLPLQVGRPARRGYE